MDQLWYKYKYKCRSIIFSFQGREERMQRDKDGVREDGTDPIREKGDNGNESLFSV